MVREKVKTIQINLKRCHVTEKEVKPVGVKKLPDGRQVISSGRIYLSPKWVGRNVIVVLKDDLD